MTQVGKLEYDLTDPDARREFELALATPRLTGFCWDLLQALRSEIKYGGFFATHPGPATPEEIREWVIKELDERNLLTLVEV